VFAAVRYVRDSMPDTIDPHGRHVALALASFADTAGHAKPSTRQLADVTGLSLNTITARIRMLEDAGVIAVQRRDRRTSLYRFPVQSAVELSPSVAPRARQMSYPHLSQRRGNLSHPGRDSWKDPLETTATAAHTDERGTFLPGTGWVHPTG
jgi:DNA-binding transcriptional MocR family regulator